MVMVAVLQRNQATPETNTSAQLFVSCKDLNCKIHEREVMMIDNSFNSMLQFIFREILLLQGNWFGLTNSFKHRANSVR